MTHDAGWTALFLSAWAVCWGFAILWFAHASTQRAHRVALSLLRLGKRERDRSRKELIEVLDRFLSRTFEEFSTLRTVLSEREPDVEQPEVPTDREVDQAAMETWLRDRERVAGTTNGQPS